MNTQANNHYQTVADAFGKAVTARLSEGAEDLPYDISERLKAARAQAVSKRKVVSTQVAANAVSMSGGEATLQFGGREDGFWSRMAGLLPLLALVAGLITIAVLQDELRAREVAEVDAELLTDELPPSAYVDPGFAQFLRINQSN
jgi:hypothetical protein